MRENHIGGVAQGWRTSKWDEAQAAGRILLVWQATSGLREHIELGKWSGSAWTNTYGKPFSGYPDGWAPLKPFAAQPPAAPVEADIVAELREAAGNLIKGNIEDGEVSTQMLCQAADEIERLTADYNEMRAAHDKLVSRSSADIGDEA